MGFHFAWRNLTCSGGDVYYGPIVATHDVYTWDATTLIGSLQSSFDAGCDGAPGSLTYPFTPTRM